MEVLHIKQLEILLKLILKCLKKAQVYIKQAILNYDKTRSHIGILGGSLTWRWNKYPFLLENKIKY